MRNRKTGRGKPLFIAIGIVLLLLFLLITVVVLQRQQTVQQHAAGTLVKTFSATFSSLHVAGNQLQNAQGQQVVLRGVDIMGTEYKCIDGKNQVFDGPADAAAAQAIKKANMNAVAVLLNEDCWLGINGANPGGTAYQTAIKQWVSLLESNGIYPVISFMWGTPGSQQALGHPSIADADHTPAFWTSVANTFKNDQAVIFRLQQEPHDISWQCWKNGGGSCNVGYSAVGLQSLVNTIRATGAKNVLGLSGIDWANNMDQFLANKPADTLKPENLIAMVDVYGDNPCSSTSCYDSIYAPIAAHMPFMAGEFGENTACSGGSNTKSNELLDWLDRHNSGYLAWSWSTSSRTINCSDTNTYLARLARLAGNPTVSTIGNGSF